MLLLWTTSGSDDRKEAMENITFVLVAGFFSSGSSAVTSLLREFDNTYEGETEFRIIKDPGGICELERALVDNWEIINSTAAIDDFLRLCRICNRRNSKMPLSPSGLSYRDKINMDFLSITKEYIQSLTAYTYQSDYYFQKFRKNYFRYVTDRCRMGIEVYSKGRIRVSKKQKSYFAKPSQEQFSKATKEYLEKLYTPHIKPGADNYVVLDQAVSAHNPEVIHRYFHRAKMIVVERDPRDMYIDSIMREGAWDDNPTSYEAGLRFTMRQKAMREIRVDDPDVLYIKYEDIMLNYHDTVKKICGFLGLREENHIAPGRYVIPEKASQYVGFWRDYTVKYREAFRAIETEMKNALFEQCL